VTLLLSEASFELSEAKFIKIERSEIPSEGNDAMGEAKSIAVERSDRSY
jgi:hypothetical protein